MLSYAFLSHAKLFTHQTYRKLTISFFALAAAMLACSVPFAIADKVYSPTDYLVPALNGLPAVMLLFVATLLVKLIKRRNLDKHGPHLMKSKAQEQ